MLDGNLPIDRPVPETTEHEFVASFDGQCSVCNLPTRAGELIAKTSRRRYVHPECAP